MREKIAAFFKNRKKVHIALRALIQLGFFLFLPSAFTAAFSGVKYIFTQIGIGERIELTSFVTMLLVLCVYTIIFGRFFCGFACAFGSFGDAVHAGYLWICKKLKKKPVKISKRVAAVFSYLKYIVLAAIVLLCFGGIYAKTAGYSPWEVFSLLHAGNFHLGGHEIGIVLLLLILAGMCVQERFFCRFLCPMGAVFSLLPVLPPFWLVRNRENCISGCSACTKKCMADIELPSAEAPEVRGECFQCQKCVDTCPRENVHCVSGLRGNEIWFTLLKTVLLAGLLLFL